MQNLTYSISSKIALKKKKVNSKKPFPFQILIGIFFNVFFVPKLIQSISTCCHAVYVLGIAAVYSFRHYMEKGLCDVVYVYIYV